MDVAVFERQMVFTDLKDYVPGKTYIRYTFDLSLLPQEQDNNGWTQEGENLTREFVVVFDGIDKYHTVILPKGYIGNARTIPTDVNHARENTGAYSTEWRTVPEIEVNWIDGEKKTLTNALIAKIIIPPLAEARYKVVGVAPSGQRYHTGEVKSNGNLQEMARKGLFNAISVDFKPIPYLNPETKRVEGGEVTDTTTGIVTYRWWTAGWLSLITLSPGQQFSGFVRTEEIPISDVDFQPQNIKPIMFKFKAGEEFSRQSQIKILSEAEQREGKNFYRVATEAGEVEMEETELEAMASQPATPGETPEPETKPESEPEKTEESNQRAWVGQAVKSKDGEFGLITSKLSQIDQNESEITNYTVQKLSGETVLTNSVGYKSEFSENEAPSEWVQVDTNSLVLELLKKVNAPTPNIRADEPKAESEPETKTDQTNADSEAEKAALEKELAEKETQLRIYKEKEQAKLAVSSSDSVNIRSSTDQDESAAQQETDAEAHALELERIEAQAAEASYMRENGNF